MNKPQNPSELVNEVKIMALEMLKFARGQDYHPVKAGTACLLLAASIMSDNKKMALQVFADMLDHSEGWHDEWRKK
jgi:hypothetical protein